MIRRHAPVLTALVLTSCAPAAWRPTPLETVDLSARHDRTYRWNFDGQEASDWLELSGDWRVDRDPSAPSPPFVLRSHQHPEAPVLNHVVVGEVTFSDADLRVRCRSLQPDAGQCGLTFRVSDGEHFYAARVEGQERRLVLYRVARSWQPVASVDVGPLGEGWHVLEVRVRGTEHRIRWDNLDALDVRDDGLPAAGAAGLLADGNGSTEYDDFEGRAL